MAACSPPAACPEPGSFRNPGNWRIPPSRWCESAGLACTTPAIGSKVEDLGWKIEGQRLPTPVDDAHDDHRTTGPSGKTLLAGGTLVNYPNLVQSFFEGLRSQNKAAAPSRKVRAARRSLFAHPFFKGSAAKIRNYGTRGINPRRASGLKRTCRVIERTLLLRFVSLALEPIVAATVAVRASLGTRVTVMDAESGFAIVPRLHVATLLAMGQELGLA